MELARVDPADAAGAEAWWRLLSSAAQVDTPAEPAPCPVTTVAVVRLPLPDARTEHWLATEGGAVIGGALLELPLLDNTDSALGHIVVAPNRRRYGVGRVLHEHLTRRARFAGRRRVVDEVREGSAGPEFAAAVGARRVHGELQLRLDLDAVDAKAHAALGERAARHSRAYQLRSWTGVSPPELLAGDAALMQRMSTDPPMGQLAWEPEPYDETRRGTEERRFEEWGLRRYSTAAIHRATGEVAGITAMGFEATWREHAHQWSTIVSPEHRGHRLGLLLKIQNLRRVREREPALRTVWTWNAAENAHMVAINEALGFRVSGAMSEWQYELDPPAAVAKQASRAAANVDNSARPESSRR